MIDWLTIVGVVVSVIVGLGVVVLGLAGRKPDDITLGGAVVVEVYLIAQIVVAIVSPAFGNHPTGSGLEFWVYLVTAAILPPLTILWGLIERTRWSTVVVGVGALAVAVMVYRMHQIWFVQVA
jgi:hypothetical protein